MKNVILSSPLILEDGVYKMRTLDLEEALDLIAEVKDTDHKFISYTQHQTIKLFLMNPSDARYGCSSYDRAICIKPKSRLEFGKEYSFEEILEIGVKIQLIEKLIYEN